MHYDIDSNQKVLVTGATGYVAGWIVKQLVEAGVCVHAAVRDPDNELKVARLKALSEKGPGKVVLFKSDLLESGSYGQAMQGCATVFHTASPFVGRFNDAQQDLINPALLGTENVLLTANSTASVKRVVLTSSLVAIYGDAQDCAAAPNGTLTEEIWNTTSSVTHQPYAYSKTLAERAAWDIAEAQDQWSLVVINPGLVIGPTVSEQPTSLSHDICKSFGDGRMKVGTLPLELGMVDVRDVADAHLRAAYIKAASGRHIIVSEAKSFLGLARLLSEKYGADYPLPRKELPKLLIWLIGPIMDSTITRKFVSRNAGCQWRASNSKSKEQLGMRYRSLKGSIEEMFQQMIDQDIFSKK